MFSCLLLQKLINQLIKEVNGKKSASAVMKAVASTGRLVFVALTRRKLCLLLTLVLVAPGLSLYSDEMSN